MKPHEDKAGDILPASEKKKKKDNHICIFMSLLRLLP